MGNVFLLFLAPKLFFEPLCSSLTSFLNGCQIYFDFIMANPCITLLCKTNGTEGPVAKILLFSVSYCCPFFAMSCGGEHKKRFRAIFLFRYREMRIDELSCEQRQLVAVFPPLAKKPTQKKQKPNRKRPPSLQCSASTPRFISQQSLHTVLSPSTIQTKCLILVPYCIPRVFWVSTW